MRGNGWSERFRAAIRGRLGYQSRLYAFASRVARTWLALRHEGLHGLEVLGMARSAGEGQWVTLRGLSFPIFLRPGTEDIGSIVDNVFREEYGQFPADYSPSVVVDAGAYIGDTSAYFLSRFASCRVIALEPNPESARIASRNLAPYGDRAKLHAKALWHCSGSIMLAGSETGAAISSQGEQIASISFDDLMSMEAIDRVDLLKMDIEGAEAVVLKSGVDGWLRKIGMLLLETHGVEIEDSVLPLLRDAGFSLRRHRNVWYCSNVRY